MAYINQLIQDAQKYLMNTYQPLPLLPNKGIESRLYTEDGSVYIDFLAGIAVNNLGYSNKHVQKAVHSAVDHLIHTSNYFYIPSQVKAAQLLVEQSFADKVFFSNSGAEANEGALKIARRKAYQQYGPQKNEVIAFTHAFHGRTLATMNMTDNASYREGYGPHPEGFTFVPYNDVKAFSESISERTAAVILEPIQGEGGVHVAHDDFMVALRELTQRFDAALIFDEVQTGMGRTGKLFAYEHWGIEPDIMTLAKALANGVPIGAILAKGDYAEVLTPGSHGTTFGGNPLATSAAVSVMEVMLNEDIPALAAKRGDYLRTGLQRLAQDQPLIQEIRGKGLLIGVELKQAGAAIVQTMLERGFIINCTQGNVLRFLPPLIIREAEIDAMLAALSEVMAKISGQGSHTE